MQALTWSSDPAVILAMLAGLLGIGGVPVGIPPAEEDQVVLSIAPQECLFYAAWAGTAQPDPQSGNRAEQLLAEPEVRQFVAGLEKVIDQAVKRAAQNAPVPARPLLGDAAQWWKKIATSPGALFVTGARTSGGRPDIRVGLVVHLGDDADRLKAALVKHQERILGRLAGEIALGDSTWYRVRLQPGVPEITWGVKEGYFGVGVGEGIVEGMLERAEGEPPEWLVRIGEQLPIERRATVTYLNVDAVKTLVLERTSGVRGAVQAFGLDQVKSLTAVTGLGEEDYVSRALIHFEGEPRGPWTALANQPLTVDDLSQVPGDALAASIAKIDPQKAWQAVLSALEALNPRGREELEREFDRIEKRSGINIPAGLIEPVGDVWRIYVTPSASGSMFTGLTAVIDVEDRRRMAETLRHVPELIAKEEDRPDGFRAERFEFAGQEVFFVSGGRRPFPLAPAWCLTENRLVLGLFPQNIKAYLAQRDEAESLAKVPEVARLFESGKEPAKFAYVDTRRLFELVYPFVLMGTQAGTVELKRQGLDLDVSLLPSAGAIARHLRPAVTAVRRTDVGIEIVSRQTLPGGNLGASLPAAAALLLPAAQSSRQAARRAQSMNNMKQILLAFHNYHDTYRHFPAQYTTGKEGKALLSWRVHILPFVEQQALYEQFHLDEPWDSKHNKTLIAQIPEVYRAPGSQAEAGKTNYLAVSGEKALFPGGRAIGMRDIKDGTSNTIALVEAADSSALVWTAPEDFPADLENPAENLSSLVGLRSDGFLAGLADGSVRFVNKALAANVLKALFTRDGGEVVGQF